MHESGFTHNDLKLENLMIKECKNAKMDSNLVVIDYGYATRYQEKNGKHIKQHTTEAFKGNIIFASAAQLEF